MPGALRTFNAEFFKALTHPARIHILDALRDSEQSVSALQQTLGLDQSAVSQQLTVLRAKGLLTARKVGTTVLYSARDPLIYDLLDVARAIFNNQLVDTRDLLSQLATDGDSGPAHDGEALA